MAPSQHTGVAAQCTLMHYCLLCTLCKTYLKMKLSSSALCRGELTTRGPRAIGDHGAPVPLPKLKKAYEKGTRGISWGPLLTPGPRAVPKFPNGQSAPGVVTTVEAS
ncbi:unnamed protein product, partial [Staurois parvus]